MHGRLSELKWRVFIRTKFSETLHRQTNKKVLHSLLQFMKGIILMKKFQTESSTGLYSTTKQLRTSSLHNEVVIGLPAFVNDILE